MVTVITETNYLDLYNLFANELIGDYILFWLIGAIILIYVAAKQRVPFSIAIIYQFTWMSICFAGSTGYLIFWLLPVLGSGVIFYYWLSQGFRD
jgi:hypothetical protein